MKETMGMTFSMTGAFLASIVMGIVSAQTFDHQLMLSLLISSIFASCVGYFSGKRVSLVALLNSVLAGLAGAMVGSVFGVMLFTSNKVILITDTVFVIFLFLLQRMIDRQSGEMSHQNTLTKMPVKPLKQKYAYIVTLILSISIFTLSFFIILKKDDFSTTQIGQPQTQYATLDEENDLQEGTIEVTASGLSPINTIFAEGTVMKITLHVDSHLADGLRLVSGDLGIDAELSEGDNIFIINKPNSGTYEFELDQTSFKGTITIE
ncbi:NAD(P)(+) transhydrogenase (Re/Si-specific) subunit beta [Cytobacillus depressus]|uniref:NAD(P)(+) transhydrogenase (Re/Si-specific) subunit beta n=2 Tax=Cytobacillus depressus TaxID=1602942 RepID=A0A6L3V2W0_9BACI|nr:NAD(P)(+) transhydrogenase (Re/Si-specific) subunit beta [Cytobacillus depressus]